MAGVNVKLGVSGVQQFKQGIKESQAAVKTLDAELKLNEQRFKSNGDSQQYMEQKTKLLQEQIKKQTEVVEQAQKALEAMTKNGVKESSTAFQAMRQQSLNAQTQLAAMQAELDNVGSSGSEAANELSGINSVLTNIKQNASWEGIAEGIDKITSKMQAAGKAAWDMGKKIVNATLGAGQWADDLQTTADKWEMKPEDVWRMRQTANLIDTDAETIFQARKKLTQAMGNEGSAETMGAFAALGISDLSGTDKNIEDIFWTAGEGLMKMEDKVARNEYAMKLYGRSWEELIPIFKAGRKAYDETYASWTWMGDEQFGKLTSLNDAQMKYQTEWEAFQHQFEAALAPAMTEILTILQELIHEFNTYLQSEDGQQMLKDLGDAVRSIFEDLKEVKPQEVMEKIKDALESIRKGLEWLVEHKEEVKTAIKIIGAAFAGMRLTGVAANIMRIVTGAKTLLPAAGAGAAGAAGSGAGAGAAGAAGTEAAKVGLGKVLVGLGGLYLIGSGFDWASQRRNFTPELVRGTDENLMMQAGGVEGLLVDYISAMRAQGALTWDASADEVIAAEERARESRERLFAAEGGREAYGAYNDWRQEHSYGADYWEVPEYLDRMTEVAGESTGATEKSTAATEKMTGAAEALSKMPAEMGTVIERSIRSGMSGVTIIVNESGIDTIGRRIGGAMGQNLMAMQ